MPLLSNCAATAAKIECPPPSDYLIKQTKEVEYASKITYGDLILSISEWRKQLKQCNADKKTIGGMYEY